LGISRELAELVNLTRNTYNALLYLFQHGAPDTLAGSREA
jgi:hypothetical protein